MKLEVGDYVRTKNNGVCKLYREFHEESVDVEIGVFPEIDGFFIDKEEISYIEKEDIIKASKNIIDLIQVGDILLIKNFVDEACMIFNDMYYIQNENQLFNIKRDLEKNKNMKISKILTKEQFESMAYEVEE